MSRVRVGPFNRVEGDLEVSLEVRDGAVAEAWVNAPLYRGFEEILRGREAGDAMVYAPRVCGICSVSQSVAAALALAQATGARPPPNGVLAANLVHAVENAADHLSHFYLFFMPDFARPVYAGQRWHAALADRFTAVRGSAHAQVLAARSRLLTMMGLLAGRWPHSLAVQPGGSTRAVSAAEKTRLLATLREVRAFLESATYGDSLEAVAALDGAEALDAWQAAAPRGDAGLFLEAAASLGLERLGRHDGPLLSFGAYHGEDGPAFAGGVWDGAIEPLALEGIAEDVSHAWLEGDAAHPSRGDTRPLPDKPGAYTWCKAPRLDGRVAETGALARAVVDGQPLARDLLARGGANVLSRVVARLVELARLVPMMEGWVMQLRPGEPFHAAAPGTAQGRVAGLTEAARGSLGHWAEYEDGRIRNYQIVAPTTWNFSPRDAGGTPGPLEQALVGTPVGPTEDTPVAVQHVVRSYDPCMVCTVH